MFFFFVFAIFLEEEYLPLSTFETVRYEVLNLKISIDKQKGNLFFHVCRLSEFKQCRSPYEIQESLDFTQMSVLSNFLGKNEIVVKINFSHFLKLTRLFLLIFKYLEMLNLQMY